MNEWIRKFKYPLLVVLVGLALMLLPQGGEPQEQTPTVEETAPASDLGSTLEAILSQIDGAGQVRVLLTEESGRETLYQTDTRSDESSHSADTVLVEDADRRETGLVRQTLEPQYRGAVVICQGADNASVRLAIVEAVSCATGLGADQISVLKMK